MSERVRRLDTYQENNICPVKANLHGAIWSHATSLQHAYDTKKSRRILKHVLKPYDNRGLKCVVSVS